MTYIVSACLLGENCKYNGGNNRSSRVCALLADHTLIPVCPEVLGGLPVPRAPAELVCGRVCTREGTDVDREFRLGAERALKLAMEHHVDGAILQSRSPSCGVREIYDGTFSGRKIPGMGVFAALLRENGIPVTDVEEI